jgi:hypothetical protein
VILGKVKDFKEGRRIAKTFWPSARFADVKEG